ncbi:glycosyltransferase family 2 protein [Polaribacter septentrionalilitoris]|uniref:glycosyltransferase family 2 protein n=1 Tax=Polaribacter septentrionalilitoris TaxID=2494657 RepID=UPI0013578A21|nr:glycosyltransferase family 2 protein [Polaribacter septentrionalilitoris]
MSFSIVIPTKNRDSKLEKTLSVLFNIFDFKLIKIFVLDDGSSDNTKQLITQNYPDITYIRNRKSKGIHAVRNKLFSLVTSDYIISIDDDAHFLTKEIIPLIERYFKSNTEVGLLYFRSFWSIYPPIQTSHNEVAHRTKSFGAVSFALKMSDWKKIPNLLEWFLFYGEEDFIAYQLYKKNIEIHYFPDILVHHRVDIKSRKKNKDYRLRLRRSLRSGWYLYLLFYPINQIPRRFFYTLWVQIKMKVFKGDLKATLAILQALLDFFVNSPRLIKNSNRLTEKEFNTFQKLPDTKLYWVPEED